MDDFLSISDQEKLDNWIETELNGHFKVKSLKQPSIIIGVKLHQEDHLIEISQTHYIDTLLKKYGLQDMNPVSTPMDLNIKLDAIEGEASEDSEDQLLINHGYANLIGSLMYLAIATQPNIAYLVNKLTQYTSAPKAKHWTAIKKVFRYLKGTRQYKLTYRGSPELLHDDINIYCGANWASDSDQKSISGYVIVIAGGAIAWSSKKQNTVTPSTPEAKYIAATHIAKQVLWHHSLLTKLKFPLSTPSIIFYNQLAIAIVHHPKFHTCTKHIDIALHFSWDHMNKGTINMFYIKTNYNIAHISTKALTQLVHQNFTYKLGIILVKGEC